MSGRPAWTLVQSLQAGQSDIDVMALDVVWTGEFAATAGSPAHRRPGGRHLTSGTHR